MMWEVYLYGDMSIKVDRDCVEVLPWGVSASVLHPTWQRITHHLWFVPAFCAWHGNEHALAVPVSSGMYCGMSVSTA